MTSGAKTATQVRATLFAFSLLAAACGRVADSLVDDEGGAHDDAKCHAPASMVAKNTECAAVDTSSDAAHCGACGNRCLTGVTTLALAEDPSVGTIDETHVYWAERSAILKVPKTGGEPVTLAETEGMPISVAVDETDVYWTRYQPGDRLQRVPKAGGPVTTLALDHEGGSFLQLALDATSVYWIRGEEILRIPKNGGESEIAVGSKDTVDGGPATVLAFAVDDTSIYWSDGRQILRKPKCGGDTTVLAAEPQSAQGLVVAGDSLFWVNDPRGTDQDEIRRVPIVGGNVVHLTPAPDPRGLAADAEHLYWFEGVVPGRQELRSVPRTGGTSSVLTSAEISLWIAVDDTGLYFSDRSERTVKALSGTCRSGACGCPSTMADCNGTCKDLGSDPANCGACGHSCLGPESCEHGQCTCRETLCSGVCVDVTTDPMNCGGCGVPCPQGLSCYGICGGPV